jgi:GT2 family glycosyltransferase
MPSGTVSAPPPRPDPAPDPELSVVVLAWDNLEYTQAFVESVRRNTDVPYELVIVDNGSAPEAADYAEAAADVAVLNERNRGFSPGMNQGLAASKGAYVAFCNNDTVMPPAWASMLLATARDHRGAGIVVPAITGGVNNPATIREVPGTAVEALAPFSAPPPAVVFLMPTEVVRGVGGWGEEYLVASGEDVDIAFKVWVNDLDIVFDERVLVEHVGKVSSSKLEDWEARWAENRRVFLEKWTGDGEVPRLDSCDEATFARNRATAGSVAGWMTRYFAARDRERAARSKASAAPALARGVAEPSSAPGSTPRPRARLARAWRGTKRRTAQALGRSGRS